LIFEQINLKKYVKFCLLFTNVHKLSNNKFYYTFGHSTDTLKCERKAHIKLLTAKADPTVNRNCQFSFFI